MSVYKKTLAVIWEKAFILCGVLCVLLPTSPANMPLTYRDSGVFLYAGWRILNGELPYRDIWDHKPPVVFYINALGLALSNDQRWGVWFIEFFALTLAAMFGFYLIKKVFGLIASVISVLLWLLTLVFLIQGGNLTTEYTLPLQFVTLWLAYDINKPDYSPWRYFLIGLIGAIAFFTKQTAIGIWVAIIIYVTAQRFMSRQIKRWMCELFFLAIGSLTLTFYIVIVFSVQGAFSQLWSAAFRFNFVYTSDVHGFANRVKPMIEGLAPLTATGLFQLAMLGYVFALVSVFFKEKLTEKCSPLLSIGLIDLIVELILISASGRTYPHYYMTILPILSLFTGVTVWVFSSKMLGWNNFAKYVFVIGVMGSLMWGSLGNYTNTVISFRRVNDKTAINYIKAATDSQDYVLLWGAEAAVNYFTQRKSPTRFVYQYPLYIQGYANAQIIEEFLDDIITKKPQLIIDAKNPITPLYDFPIRTQSINDKIAFIQSQYREVTDMNSWIVYAYIGDNP